MRNSLKKNIPIINLWVKRIYVVVFNIYAWYWLYREIFINESTDFEQYLLWFFTTAGMYYFVLDSKDLFFYENEFLKKDEKNNTQ